MVTDLLTGTYLSSTQALQHDGVGTRAEVSVPGFAEGIPSEDLEAVRVPDNPRQVVELRSTNRCSARCRRQPASASIRSPRSTRPRCRCSPGRGRPTRRRSRSTGWPASADWSRSRSAVLRPAAALQPRPAAAGPTGAAAPVADGAGGVPSEARTVLDLPWSRRDQACYSLFWRVFPPIYRRLPRRLRSLPARLSLRDYRRRVPVRPPMF
jgi:hypothetical protein